MRNIFLNSTLLSATLVLASCGTGEAGDTAPASTPAANTGMVSGQSVSLQSSSPFAATSHGRFNEPWAMAFEPGTGNIFVTEKSGQLKFHDTDTGATHTVSGTPKVFYEGQGGLGDFVFGPNYEQDGMVYLSWAQGAGNDATVATVGRGTLVCQDDTNCRIDGLTQIWQQSRPGENKGHYSHRIAFSPDGQYLFVTSGDRQEQTPAQDLSNNLGTTVRLNLDGTPATGNPFAARGAPTNQIWTYGQRNILGLAFDSTGNLWGLEHGPAGGDELNLLQRGNNYGWPKRSGGDNYNGDPIPDHAPGDGFAKPAINWTPVIAPGDMAFYNGTMFGDWRGDLLIANLKTTSISRVTVDAAGNSADEVARYEFPERLRDISVAPDGAIWVIEDGDRGRLLRLTPKN